MTADIAWHQRPAGDALRAHVARWAGAHVPRWSRSEERQRRSLETSFESALAEIRTGRHCPACGSDSHGRPWARLPDGRSPHVSLARCGDHVVTAIADHPVGVDVESIAAVTARWDPALVLHPTEPDPDVSRRIRVRLAGSVHCPRGMQTWVDVTVAEQRAAMWCRKEAILKALGTGLRTPMSEIRVADWPVEDIPAPEGLIASVVVIAQAGSGGSSTE